MRGRQGFLVILVLIISLLSVAFRVQIVKASALIYIRNDGSISPSSVPISTTDNVTYTLTGNITYWGIVVEKSNIVIDGNGYTLQGGVSGASGEENFGIYVYSAKNVSIKNMNIKDYECGIHITNSQNNTISKNNITSSYWGIMLHSGASHNVVSENKIANNRLGIRFDTNNNTITKNNITNNGDWGIFLDGHMNNVSRNNITNSSYGTGLLIAGSSHIISGNNIKNNSNGIKILGASNSILRNNVMTDNKFNLSFFLSASNAACDIDVSNTVDGKPVYYWVNEQDKTIPSDAGYVGLVNCTRITVRGLNITNNEEGILLAQTTNSTIAQNSLKNNLYGIYLYESIGNNISYNNMTRNGINMLHSYNNTISRNKITDSSRGISLSGYIGTESCLNIISENIITNSAWCGIRVNTNVFTLIFGNTIEKKGFQGGIYLEYAPNVKIYHNNFINSNAQSDYSSKICTWDNGIEGNYWSDHTGIDSNNDGIGDTPKTLFTNNQDKYPLMGMFNSFNTSMAQNVEIVSNSTIENFQYIEHNNTIRINVSNKTTNQTFGFCRICIPHALMYEPYNVTINNAQPHFANYTLHDNDTHRWIYFTYQHSIHEVIIIPESTLPIIFPLLIITTTLAIALATTHKNKHQK